MQPSRRSKTTIKEKSWNIATALAKREKLEKYVCKTNEKRQNIIIKM